jgi:proteasome accessory factor C
MTRPAASERVARMLSLVPWVAAQGSAPVDEICRRFGIDEAQLLRDLDTVSMVGLYPYTPDVLIELFVDDGRVHINLPQAFDRPLSLTPEQALALVAAGSTLLATPGADRAGPLARGLDKLSIALTGRGGDEAATSIDVRFGSVSASVLDVLRESLRSRRQVAIDYYVYGRDELTHRVVDPYRVTTDQGQWYLSAHCHLAEGDRLFRIDRIRTAALLEETYEPPADIVADGVFSPSGDEPRVQIDLGADARWVVEQYPIEQVTDLTDGRSRITMIITARPWLERLLLRLGKAAVVVEGPPDLRSAGVDAARRVLSRYAGGTGPA